MSSSRDRKQRRQLILISIDGLWPGLYLHGSQTSGRLRALAQRGTSAKKARPVFPTLTYTNHATIATGAYSDRHGIQTNVLFDPRRVQDWVNGESRDWIFSADHFRVPTLWDVATANGFETSLIRWPSTAGAKVKWLIPDLFPIDDESSVWRLMEDASTPELIQALKRSPGFTPPDDIHEDLDELSFRTALHLLHASPPDLMMIHFTALDHATHEHGKSSPDIAKAIGTISRYIDELMTTSDPKLATFFVLGDHGFIEFDRRVHINSLLKEQGWIKTRKGRITDWTVIAHTQCCVAPVFTKDKDIGDAALALLRERSGAAYRVIEREELNRENAFPDALCVVEANPGYSLGQNLSGPLIEQMSSTRGEHGYSLRYPEMNTGFFAVGPGIPAGQSLNEVRLIDICPTVANLLGFAFPSTDGSKIDLPAPSQSGTSAAKPLR